MGFEDLDKLLAGELGESTEAQTKNPRPCVMIVDDDVHVLDALAALLSDKYDLVSCASGEEAVVKVDSSVHAILLDIKMKGLNGFEVFQKIKAKFNHLPIIFHSAYQDAMDPYDVMNKLRPYGYIQKGQDESRLLAIIERAVRYRMKFLKSDIKLAELMDTHKRLEQKIKERDKEIKSARTQLPDRPVPASRPPAAETSQMFPSELEEKKGLLGLGSVIVTLKQYLVEASNQGHGLSLAVLELNDTSTLRRKIGLTAMNNIIDAVAEFIVEAAEPSCISGRMGNLKFAVIMPNKDKDTATACIKKLQADISNQPFFPGTKSQRSESVTTSAGIISVQENRPPEARSMISAAERVLSRARLSNANACSAERLGGHP